MIWGKDIKWHVVSEEWLIYVLLNLQSTSEYNFSNDQQCHYWLGVTSNQCHLTVMGEIKKLSGMCWLEVIAVIHIKEGSK